MCVDLCVEPTALIRYNMTFSPARGLPYLAEPMALIWWMEDSFLRSLMPLRKSSNSGSNHSKCRWHTNSNTQQALWEIFYSSEKEWPSNTVNRSGWERIRLAAFCRSDRAADVYWSIGKPRPLSTIIYCMIFGTRLRYSHQRPASNHQTVPEDQLVFLLCPALATTHRQTLRNRWPDYLSRLP